MEEKYCGVWGHLREVYIQKKKPGHSQKEQDQFFYVKELELSNGLLYDKILKEKESEQ